MAIVSEIHIRDQVRHIAEDLGYETWKEPAAPRSRFFGWFRERPFRPDIVVKRDDRSAIVIVRSHPMMMYDVFQAHQARIQWNAQALICVSDSAFERVRGSAIEYADELGVHLCRLSEVGDALSGLLE